MIDPADLRAAVGAGILTEAQAASLVQLSHARTGARHDLSAGDEPFELFKGFNEIFIVVGLVILALGWSGMIAATMGARIGDVQGQALSFGAAGAIVVWILAEYFTRRRRMVAPSIALAILFAGNAATALAAIGGERAAAQLRAAAGRAHRGGFDCDRGEPHRLLPW